MNTKNILSFILSLVAIMNILGFVNLVGWLYPITMFVLLLYMLCNKNVKIDKSIAFFVFVCILSIVINDPNSMFRSWERLAYFVMILLVLSPIICNYKISFLRMKIFSATVVLLIISSVLSFICYFLGVNFMRYDGSNMAEIVSGSFSGITSHSMILGPVAALSCCYLFSCLFNPAFNKKIRILIFAAFFASIGSLLFSASRGALIGGITGLLFVLYKLHADRIGRFIKYLILIIGIGAVSFPLWADMANMVMAKQQNNIEHGSAFSSRDRKWNARQAEFESSPMFGIGFATIDLHLDQGVGSGVVEPGTSWGGVLSMLGILGFMPFCYIVFSNFFYLLQDTRNKLSSACLGGCLSFFMVHLIVEGYLLAAGSYLCFLFWLLLGVIAAQRKNNLTVFLLK